MVSYSYRGLLNKCYECSNYLETYPWWPSVVYEEDHQEVPEGVLRQKVNAPRGGFGPLLLVQFFDARKTWWVYRAIDIDIYDSYSVY